MLDIALSSVDHLLDCQADGHMSREGQILAACLLRHREKRLARSMVVDLDQIHASALEQLNRGPAVLGGLHAHSERPVARRIIEYRSRREDARSEHAAR